MDERRAVQHFLKEQERLTKTLDRFFMIIKRPEPDMYRFADADYATKNYIELKLSEIKMKLEGAGKRERR